MKAAPGLDAMTVEKVDCLILGPKAQPVPIPTIKECGVICVPINSTDHLCEQDPRQSLSGRTTIGGEGIRRINPESVGGTD